MRSRRALRSSQVLNKSIRSGAIICDIESLYIGILFGAALATLALTNGSRMCELLQMSADRFKTRTYKVKQEGQDTDEERVLHLQLLLPKFKNTEEERKLFLISDEAYMFLCEIAQELRNVHGGRIPTVQPSPQNNKAPDLKPERYLFQWGASTDGRLGAIWPRDVSYLLRFILFGLEFSTKEGETFNVSVHLLRHVMATVARHDYEVPIEAVAYALHHEQRRGRTSRHG